MNKLIARRISAALVALSLSSVALIGCASGPVESEFDSPRPWADGSSSGSYEKLDYAVTVYDETNGTEEGDRVAIADGKLTFKIDMLPLIVNEYTKFSTELSYTFRDNAGADAGLTDRMTSYVEFTTESLYANIMNKTVLLADREGTDNLSYTVTADYMTERKATYQALDGNGEPKKVQNANGELVENKREIDLPSNARRDNEMMFMLARAQKIAPESATTFLATNVFETFARNEFTEFSMRVQTGKDTVTMYPGEWVKDFGVEAVTDDSGNTSYPVACFTTSIGINDTHAGPPYTVLFTQNPFVSGGKSHSKIPLRIGYRQYKQGKAYRYAEYMLTGCSFTK